MSNRCTRRSGCPIDWIRKNGSALCSASVWTREMRNEKKILKWEQFIDSRFRLYFLSIFEQLHAYANLGPASSDRCWGSERGAISVGHSLEWNITCPYSSFCRALSIAFQMVFMVDHNRHWDFIRDSKGGHGRIAYQETGIIQEFDGHFRHMVSKIKKSRS